VVGTTFKVGAGDAVAGMAVRDVAVGAGDAVADGTVVAV